MSKSAIEANVAVRILVRLLFNIKWLLPLFYFGLVVVLGMYFVVFAKEIISVVGKVSTVEADGMKIIALDVVDMVMIANLIKMITTGSYNSFISKEHGYANENISSGMLKIKIATSVIVVMMIHMLKTFVEYEVNWDLLNKQLWVFGGTLLGALVLGGLELMHVFGEKIEHELHRKSSSGTHQSDSD